MPKKLAEVSPTMLRELLEALDDIGEGELAELLENAFVVECTYDKQADASYVYFVKPLKEAGEIAPVSRTVALGKPYWLNLDVSPNGGLFGVEVLWRKELVNELRNSGWIKLR